MSYFSDRLKKQRNELGLTMQALADRAGISKSMICKMERDEAQPTIDIAARVAEALGLTLTEMLHSPQKAHAILTSQKEQSTWEDAQHIKRRTLSPVFEGLKLDWLEVTIPPKTTLCKTDMRSDDRERKIEKYVLLKEGRLDVKVGQQTYHLQQGDCLYFDARIPHEWINHDEKNSAEFYLIIHY